MERRFQDLVLHFPHYQASTPMTLFYYGDYKLMCYYETGKDSLFNITTDIAEKNDLSSSKSSIAKKWDYAHSSTQCTRSRTPEKESFIRSYQSYHLG